MVISLGGILNCPRQSLRQGNDRNNLNLELTKFDIEQTQVDQIVGVGDGRVVVTGIDGDTVALQEVGGEHLVEVKFDGAQNGHFHGEQLGHSIGVLCDKNEIRGNVRVQIVKFARNKHRCDPNQLISVDFHLILAQIPIDKAHCGLDCLWEQLELHLDNQQPVDEDFAVLRRHVKLILEAVYGVARQSLGLQHALVDGLDVLSMGDFGVFGQPNAANGTLWGA